jgi:hypothetical protein
MRSCCAISVRTGLTPRVFAVEASAGASGLNRRIGGGSGGWWLSLRLAHLDRAGPWALLDEGDLLAADKAVEVERCLEPAAVEEVILPPRR